MDFLKITYLIMVINNSFRFVCISMTNLHKVALNTTKSNVIKFIWDGFKLNQFKFHFIYDIIKFLM